MILKMKLVSMFDKRERFDEILENYLMNMDIEFENPLNLFKSAHGFSPHTEPNPYEAVLRRFEGVFEYTGVDYKDVKRRRGCFTDEELAQFIDGFDKQIHSVRDELYAIDEKMRKAETVKTTLSPIIDSDVHIDDLTKLKYMKFRFGKMPVDSYRRLEAYIGDLPVYFTAVKNDKTNVWGFYFAASEKAHQVDHIMTTLYFERIRIDGEGGGTPREAVLRAEAQLAQLEKERAVLSEKATKLIEIQKDDLLEAFACVKFFYERNQLKRYAAYTKNNFYLTFWADEKDAEKLKKLSEDESNNLNVMIEEADAVAETKPPTKLRNIAIFRPFEEFVKMYGVPRYNEIDPTPFLAVIYSLLFGMMFGDVGHGACLLLAGILLTIFKKGGFLGKIAIPIGVTSTFFGFMYGTFFGFEGHEAIIKPLWFTPMEDMMKILIITVAIGVGIILLCMLFNVVNGIKQKNRHKIIFSQNGLAGLFFYVLVLYAALSIFLGSEAPLKVVGIGIGVSLLLIFLQEPLSHLAEGRKDWLPKEKGGFLVQAFFELFEIVLSFVTNTVSFVRVGAFALNHAGMMSVVLMFMKSMNGTGSIVVAILGNLLVMGLEGLIVGIQVLRLGFYEMFSRFYEGDGRAFKSVNN